MKKKSTTKVENTEIADPIKESEIKEDGGNKPKKIAIKTVINKAKSSANPSLFHIVIDELNDDSKEILNSLWDWGCVFTVASKDTDKLSKFNFDYMNRSYSMGRYFYVSSSEDCYRQACDLLVLCKEKYDSFTSFNFAKETIRYYKD